MSKLCGHIYSAAWGSESCRFQVALTLTYNLRQSSVNVKCYTHAHFCVTILKRTLEKGGWGLGVVGYCGAIGYGSVNDVLQMHFMVLFGPLSVTDALT